jgi:hypothetical protein
MVSQVGSWVPLYLFLQGNDSAGQPMAGYVDSGEVVLLEGIDLVG